MRDDILIPLGIILALLYFTTKANAAGGTTTTGTSSAGSGTSPTPGTPGIASGGVTTPGPVTQSGCPTGQNPYSIYHVVSDYFENGCDANIAPGSVIIRND